MPIILILDVGCTACQRIWVEEELSFLARSFRFRLDKRETSSVTLQDIIFGIAFQTRAAPFSRSEFPPQGIHHDRGTRQT